MCRITLGAGPVQSAVRYLTPARVLLKVGSDAVAPVYWSESRPLCTGMSRDGPWVWVGTL
ncbi:hypothetical protein ACM01_06405 [Streptomyces viridochromogenes]|uniref:Uncharacterized protein n=1 Tax=Streptomyces viridochromogenes TaxID=1938 RepID=A0A0J8CED6_STRVR|nr:hypothetical protein ACM01_06405 [Streptomyces viridochromogenes]KOG20433.1 hypothetical protein ADK36_16920 [Streptomyces viridochromogenes]KOG22276.1 hypothetical protein ADK35_15530 [Streptomyces viridochromogenes]